MRCLKLYAGLAVASLSFGLSAVSNAQQISCSAQAEKNLHDCRVFCINNMSGSKELSFCSKRCYSVYQDEAARCAAEDQRLCYGNAEKNLSACRKSCTNGACVDRCYRVYRDEVTNCAGLVGGTSGAMATPASAAARSRVLRMMMTNVNNSRAMQSLAGTLPC